MIELIDTHAHLFAKEFDSDRNEVILRAKECGVTKILLPNIDASTLGAMDQLVASEQSYCLPMYGLHPCSVKNNFQKDLKTIENHMDQQKNGVAVGEIGLDYHWDTNFVNEQKRAFEDQINWALDRNLPIAIHTRDSFEDAIELIEKHQNGDLRGVFHCFGGTVDEGKRILDVGFYMGIGGVVTFKKSPHPQVLPEIPLSSVLLETDAPYLAPQPFRGKRNESSYLAKIAEKLASIYETSIGEIASYTSANAQRLFNL
mgnify:CR=1 FL=1